VRGYTDQRKCKCPKCHGKGEIKVTKMVGSVEKEVETTCPKCGGSGKKGLVTK
jgi:DnaJ-class molecular chaperone